MKRLNDLKNSAQAFVEDNISKAKNVAKAGAFAIVSMVASPDANAQQSFKSKIDITGMSVVTMSTIADGTSVANVVGNK